MHKRRTLFQIITSLLDTDLYTFSLCYLYLQKFARAEGEYSFIDRNNTVYPKGFAEQVEQQIKWMSNIQLSDPEADYLKKRCTFYPEWFFTFLKGYRFDHNEVTATQDDEGHLTIKVKGKLWRTVFWEQPLLSMISEMYHEAIGDFDNYDENVEWEKSYNKCKRLSEAGLNFSEFGTRRRFSFDHQDLVIKSFVQYMKDSSDELGITGKCVGTSNVYFAFKYNLTPIGTMAHQYISAVASFYGPVEANAIAMDLWQEVYDGNLGTFLPDTFTSDVFLKNFSLKNAKLYDGIRIDSGDNVEAFLKYESKYLSHRINPTSKVIVFSNALDCDRAIKLHNIVNRRMLDSYGIGTHFTCDIDNVKPSNMVIKLTAARITENREWNNCIKLSDDKGKYTGNTETVEIYRKLLGL